MLGCAVWRRSGLGLLLAFVAFGKLEQFRTEFVRRARREAESSLERWAADVVLSRNGAPKLNPDVLVVAVNVDGVSLVDC